MEAAAPWAGERVRGVRARACPRAPTRLHPREALRGRAPPARGRAGHSAGRALHLRRYPLKSATGLRHEMAKNSRSEVLSPSMVALGEAPADASELQTTAHNPLPAADRLKHMHEQTEPKTSCNDPHTRRLSHTLYFLF